MHPLMFEFDMGMVQSLHLSCQDPQTLIGPTSLIRHQSPILNFQKARCLPMSTPLEVKTSSLLHTKTNPSVINVWSMVGCVGKFDNLATITCHEGRMSTWKCVISWGHFSKLVVGNNFDAIFTITFNIFPTNFHIKWLQVEKWKMVALQGLLWRW